MLTEKLLKSTSVKLYLLIGAVAIFFVIFFISYLSNYFSYYKDLQNYRIGLIDRLTSTRVRKPVYNSGDPYVGNLRSKITVFEYADFSCPSCAAIQPVLKQLYDFYGANNIAIIWKDLPVNTTKETLQSHQAARCAQDQGAFESYKDVLFTNQNKFSQEFFEQAASDLKLDTSAFKMCLNSNKYKELIDSNFRDALSVGLDSTPTLFINNREVRSGFNLVNLRNIIETSQ